MEPVSAPRETETTKSDTMSDYYEPVLRGLLQMEGNREAEEYFFTQTQPQDEEPTHQRAMDVDKAIAVAGEFIHKVTLSILVNGKRQWRPEPDAILNSPEVFDQPLDYYHSNDRETVEF